MPASCSSRRRPSALSFSSSASRSTTAFSRRLMSPTRRATSFSRCSSMSIFRSRLLSRSWTRRSPRSISSRRFCASASQVSRSLIVSSLPGDDRGFAQRFGLARRFVDQPRGHFLSRRTARRSAPRAPRACRLERPTKKDTAPATMMPKASTAYITIWFICIYSSTRRLTSRSPGKTLPRA